jgi:hypothetical protein
MKLSELIEKAKTTLELYGDGEVYQVGDCGEHYTDFSFLQETRGYKREKLYMVYADFPD